MTATSTKLTDLLKNEKYSDLEIVCGGHIFKVHKLIMSTLSPFFEKIIDTSMKVRDNTTEWSSTLESSLTLLKEGLENKICLPEDDPCLVHRMIEYAYTGHFTKTNKGIECDGVTDQYVNPDSTWDLHLDLLIDLFHLADKYLASHLKVRIGKNLLFALSRIKEYKHETDESARNNASGDSKIIHAAEKIITATKAEDWQIRDPVICKVLNTFHRLCPSTAHTSSWEAYHQLFSRLPELSLILLMSHKKMEMRCFLCDLEEREITTAQVLWFCKCRELHTCFDDDCHDQRLERSICLKCCDFGSIYWPRASEI